MYSLQPAVSGGLTSQRNAPLRNNRGSEKIVAQKTTAVGTPYAAGGFPKDGDGCGAWVGGHGVDAEASTPRGPMESKP